jgi:hypothetical protein
MNTKMVDLRDPKVPIAAGSSPNEERQSKERLREYQRTYARNVRRTNCKRCGGSLQDFTTATGRVIRRCYACRPIKQQSTPRARVDLAGKRFGRLLVTSEAPGIVRVAAHSKTYVRRWNCVCDCGEVRVVDQSNLTRGIQEGCGCRIGKWERRKGSEK